MSEQGSCYKCLCELFNIFWCFLVENWYDNSVSINSIFIDKTDNPNSNIDNYRLLTPNSFIEFYRISKKLIDFYRLLQNVIDYRCYRMTTSGFTLSFVLKVKTFGARTCRPASLLALTSFVGYHEVTQETGKIRPPNLYNLMDIELNQLLLKIATFIQRQHG